MILTCYSCKKEFIFHRKKKYCSECGNYENRCRRTYLKKIGGGRKIITIVCDVCGIKFNYHRIRKHCVECGKEKNILKRKCENDKEYKIKRKELAKLNYINNKERYKKTYQNLYNKNKVPAVFLTREEKIQRRKEYNKKTYQQRKLNGKLSELRKKRLLIPQNKIANNLRNRIWKSLKKQGIKKELSFLELTGCTANELKIYLENQFTGGMTWENHGMYGWHIDHIKPCASFDLTKEEEQIKCFHYTNLQPLWWYENISKGKK